MLKKSQNKLFYIFIKIKGGYEMWEKFFLATAVTFSLHIFAGIDLSDIKLPISSLSPSVTTADNQVPNLLYIEENFQFSTMKSIKTFIRQ